MVKCPVCGKVAGSGTFLCIDCGNWTHPACGSYSKKEVQGADSSTLKCNSCKLVSLLFSVDSNY